MRIPRPCFTALLLVLTGCGGYSIDLHPFTPNEGREHRTVAGVPVCLFSSSGLGNDETREAFEQAVKDGPP